MSAILIKNATVINEGKRFAADLFVDQGVIKKHLGFRKRRTSNRSKKIYTHRCYRKASNSWYY